MSALQTCSKHDALQSCFNISPLNAPAAFKQGALAAEAMPSPATGRLSPDAGPSPWGTAGAEQGSSGKPECKHRAGEDLIEIGLRSLSKQWHVCAELRQEAGESLWFPERTVRFLLLSWVKMCPPVTSGAAPLPPTSTEPPVCVGTEPLTHTKLSTCNLVGMCSTGRTQQTCP